MLKLLLFLRVNKNAPFRVCVPLNANELLIPGRTFKSTCVCVCVLAAMITSHRHTLKITFTLKKRLKKK